MPVVVVQAHGAFMSVKRLLPLPRRSVLTVTVALGLIAVLGLVIFSPLALEVLAHSRRNWSQLSNIGQTFGAVSALLSSLALGGVVISLLYQARDSKTANEVANRQFQHDLIKLELEDPSLMTAIGAPYGLPIPPDFASIRQFLYIQMWVSFLAGSYVIGGSSEPGIRHIAATELFRSAAGRSYWEAVRQTQLEISKGRRKQFFRLLDDEYEKALSRSVPIAEPVVRNDCPAPNVKHSMCKEHARQVALIAAAAVMGSLAGGLWHRRKS
jgi:hypothetical protein